MQNLREYNGTGDEDINEESYSGSFSETKVTFISKRNKNIKFDVFKSPDGRVRRIDNNTHFRFPFSVGQMISRNIETWACNNNLLIDGKDTCPEKRIFGVKISDIPQGHEWRKIFSSKFR